MAIYAYSPGLAGTSAGLATYQVGSGGVAILTVPAAKMTVSNRI